MSYEPTTWVRGTKITASKLNNIESGVESVNSEYTPTTWAEGDIVTATKLNNIEQGIANASGGGGSSDFSTAEVTVTVVNGDTTTKFLLPFINPIDEAIMVMVSALNSGVIEVPLYKGACNVRIDAGSVTNLSGDVELSGDWLFITGDCAFTVSLKNN